MIGPTLLWLIALELFAVVTFPIAYRAFPNMPDRGWALSKPLGVLGVGFVVWLIGLTHTLSTSRFTVVLALLIVGALSWTVMRTRTDEVLGFLRANLNMIVTTELVFFAAFLGMALFRASIPAINATEQPMDFMFLNAAVTSPHYPPNDPWLAGHTVSYYYLGYVLIGSISLLTGIGTAFAYNLGLATAAALGAVAAYGVTFNLVRLARGNEDGAAFAGVVAAFLLIVASNLAGTLELVRAAGIGNEAFWSAIGVNGFTAPTGPAASWRPDEYLWWWKASRVVPPGHINEFPLFSFVVGDMHPHVMSIGFVLLVVGIAVQIYLQRGLLRFQRQGHLRFWPDFTLRALAVLVAGAVGLVVLRFDLNLLWIFPLFAVLAALSFTNGRYLVLIAIVATGALAALNLWDLPLGIALIGGAVLLSAARNERSFNFGAAVAMSGDVAVVGAPNDSSTEVRAGSATVYLRRDGRWQKAGEVCPLNPMLDGRFGASVAVDNDLVAIGAPGTRTVFLYRTDDGNPMLRTTLRAPDDIEDFGRAVAVDSNEVAVSGEQVILLFKRNDGRWEVSDRLIPPEPVPGFGATISLQDGTLAVGAPESSAVLIYTREVGEWAFQQRIDSSEPMRFGRSIAVGHGSIAVGADESAAVIHRNRKAWTVGQTLEAPAGAKGFGHSVAFDRRYLVVGAEGGIEEGVDGSVAIFEDDGREWQQHSVLSVRDRTVDSYFGGAVSIGDNSVIVGSPGRGQGAAYFFHRELDQWNLSHRSVSRWRLAPAVLGLGILVGGALAVALPFMASFDSNARGVLPLLSIITRPVHLMLLWGIQAMLVLPVLAFVLPRVLTRRTWSWKRVGVVALAATAPILIWLQPVWAWPVFAVVLGLVALQKAGYRMPSADETTFAYNPRVTLLIGSLILVAGLLWDGIRNAERGAGGELLAVDRLLVTVPMALVIALAAYAAWTLAHRDSEALRVTLGPGDTRTTNDALVPVMGLLALGAMLVMGVELWYVVDVFGGDYRRMNTMFKLDYQAWLIFAVLGGFAVWYVSRHFNRSVLWGRIGIAVWTVLLLAGLGAVSYYPLAALASRSSEHNGLTLDGQAQLQRTATAEYDAIQWIRNNTARDSVVVEAAIVLCPSEPNGCHSYTEAGRISASTGRPTIIGWLGHERQWRNSALHPELDRRVVDVRTIYETPDPAIAANLLGEYAADYVVVGPRETAAYGRAGLAKWDSLGTVVFHEVRGIQEVTIYQLHSGEAA